MEFAGDGVRITESRTVCYDLTIPHEQSGGKALNAKIVFVDDVFKLCDFKIAQHHYSIYNWKQIGELSKTILELQDKHSGKEPS